MTKDERIKYWLNTATQDWKVAGHLFEKGDYSYALFFGHLALEKTLKAIYVKKQDETPPFSHNLVYLSEKAGLELEQKNLKLFEEISDYNLEARYPDDKLSFFRKCTIEFQKTSLNKLRG